MYRKCEFEKFTKKHVCKNGTKDTWIKKEKEIKGVSNILKGCDISLFHQILSLKPTFFKTMLLLTIFRVSPKGVYRGSLRHGQYDVKWTAGLFQEYGIFRF